MQAFCTVCCKIQNNLKICFWHIYENDNSQIHLYNLWFLIAPRRIFNNIKTLTRCSEGKMPGDKIGYCNTKLRPRVEAQTRNHAEEILRK